MAKETELHNQMEKSSSLNLELFIIKLFKIKSLLCLKSTFQNASTLIWFIFDELSIIIMIKY